MSSKPSNKFVFPTLSFHCAAIALVFGLAIFRFFISDFSDRHHCQALLNDGRWLDSAHTSWQPDGCMLHPYSTPQVTQCLDGRHVIFIGDSTVRQVFYAAVKHVDKNVDTNGEKHSDRSITVGRIQFSFFWDPFLNGTRTAGFLDGSLARSVGGSVPTLAVVGSGIWYLRHAESGGIPEWKNRMNTLFKAAEPAAVNVIADEVILLPVENTVESRLSPERAATLHAVDIVTMNEHLDSLLHSAEHAQGKGPTLAIPRVFNKLIVGLDEETEDGIHFSEGVSKVQASILLNLRCNDVLPKKFPFDKTCCSQYPTPNWVQIALLIIFLVWAPAGLYFYSRPDTIPRLFAFFPDQKYLVPAAIFGFALSFLFIADRTSLFLKENKQYDAITFAILSFVALLAGFLTLKPADKDLGFLNREQTDEWKGWMQIAILIYHYLGASKISGIYNPIRVLVAAYLFQTGYGHLTFFLKKADFGFSRVANIIVRLNLLTVGLAYLMDTDYLSYYFSPLVTIWFLIIWVTMWTGHAYNDRTPFLVVKLLIAAGLTGAYFKIEGPLEGTFSVLNTVFGTAWNAKEWRFRVTLDMWVVWTGMFTALAFIKIKEARITERPEWPTWQRWTIWVSAISMTGYFVFELTRASKFVYNAYHPYISVIPVLAFCVLRNATPYLRSTSSKFFIFFGQCSLETFIIQFHLFIAADTRGIIMMIPGGAWMRPINFLVTSVVFVFVSNQTASATGSLTEWICNKGAGRLPHSAPAPPAAEYVPLATTGEGASDGPALDEKAMPPIPIEPAGILAKLGSWAKKDLRVKFVMIFCGLWVLNEVYPTS